MSRLAIVLLITASVGLSGAAVIAEEGCQLRVGAIVASNSGQLEKGLEKFHERWRNLLQYSSYKMLTDESKQARWRTRVGFDVPGGRYLVISPRAMRDKKILLQVFLVEGSRPLVDTVVWVADGGDVIVGGQKHPEGMLLLSIGARTATSEPWKTSSIAFGAN